MMRPFKRRAVPAHIAKRRESLSGNRAHHNPSNRCHPAPPASATASASAGPEGIKPEAHKRKLMICDRCKTTQALRGPAASGDAQQRQAGWIRINRQKGMQTRFDLTIIAAVSSCKYCAGSSSNNNSNSSNLGAKLSRCLRTHHGETPSRNHSSDSGRRRDALLKIARRAVGLPRKPAGPSRKPPPPPTAATSAAHCRLQHPYDYPLTTARPHAASRQSHTLPAKALPELVDALARADKGPRQPIAVTSPLFFSPPARAPADARYSLPDLRLDATPTRDYSCALDHAGVRHYGRLYVTPTHVCFTGTRISLAKPNASDANIARSCAKPHASLSDVSQPSGLWQKIRIRVPVTDVRRVSKETTLGVWPNAIAVSTDKRCYIFTNVLRRDRAFADLERVCGREKCGSEATERDRRRPKKNSKCAGYRPPTPYVKPKTALPSLPPQLPSTPNHLPKLAHQPATVAAAAEPRRADRGLERVEPKELRQRNATVQERKTNRVDMESVWRKRLDMLAIIMFPVFLVIGAVLCSFGGFPWVLIDL